MILVFQKDQERDNGKINAMQTTIAELRQELDKRRICWR